LSILETTSLDITYVTKSAKSAKAAVVVRVVSTIVMADIGPKSHLGGFCGS